MLQSITYSTPGTYTFTPGAGVTAVWALIQGAGSSGSPTQTFGSFGNSGGGGSSGELVDAKLIPITGGSLTVVVGVGGISTNAFPWGHPGTAGGSCSVGARIALGGPNSGASSASVQGAPGGGVRGGLGSPGIGLGNGLWGSLDDPRDQGGGGGGSGCTGGGAGSDGAPAPGCVGQGGHGSGPGGGGGGASMFGKGGTGGNDGFGGSGGTGPGAGGGGASGNSGTPGGSGGDGIVTLFWAGP